MASDDIEATIANSDLDEKIIRQVEYYFGDHNLGRDKFLKDATSKNEGWVPLEILVKFNRLKCLTTDFTVITDALKKSNAGLLEVHEDGSQIRRSQSKPLPTYDERRQEDVDGRSVYVKGFPTDLSIDDILAYFKDHGNVEHVQMRYEFVDKNKKVTTPKQNRFKGSVFVVYPTTEEAVEFQKKADVKYKDTDLLREMRQDYFTRKRAERALHKDQRKKEKNESNQKAMADDEIENKAIEFQKGCVLHLSNVNETSRHEEIKAYFEVYAAVAFVDYKTGLVEADVRFKEANAQEALDKALEGNDGKIVIKGAEIIARVLEGEEETEFWKKSLKDRELSRQRKQNHRGGGRGGRGRFGGGRGGRFNQKREGFKRRAEEDNNGVEPAVKKDKTDEDVVKQETTVIETTKTSAEPSKEVPAKNEMSDAKEEKAV